ncbi:hypothetical protein [Pontibacter anaerobius]|uniref:Uncharacterized protein n=1 Tax=Pontibacter anaerobius TaxID=2993940 RepID=A0ABT3RFU3_9BACT|nr:hypothetical protein [Pontibacter anaerobius]MCX2740699.1 hypothetical protein [Pontibacter anaerobius]
MKTLFLIIAVLVGLYLAGKDLLRDVMPTTDCPTQVAARQQLLATAPAPASAYTYTIG